MRRPVAKKRLSPKGKAKAKRGILSFGPGDQAGRHQQLVDLMRACPIPDEELARNLGLFLVPQTLSRLLFMDFLYRSALEVQGVVMEFGCRWGQNLVLFSAMRGIYEPFNRLRKIVGFDSFAGFPGVDRKDGRRVIAGDYATTKGYEAYLGQLLTLSEAESPLSHLKKYELVKGDVGKTLPRYLKANPSTTVALAYFDLDIYQPTRACLRAIRNRMTRGTVIGFDEVNDETTPGETLALMEELGLRNVRLKRWPWSARTSYLVVE
jgi:hypothetical protein